MLPKITRVASVEAVGGALLESCMPVCRAGRCPRPIPLLSEFSIREEQQSLAIVYVARARKLTEECGAAWPLELEQATKNLCRCELQMIW